MRQVALVVIGVVALGAGVAVLLDPTLAAGLQAEFVYILALGGALLLVGVIRVHRARQRRPPAVEVPDPERPTEHPVPGEALDRAWDDFRMRSVAIKVLRRANGWSEAEAKRRLSAGTWTDDPVAAAYFGEPHPGGPIDRVRAKLFGRLRHRQRRRRAIEVLAEVASVESREETA
ncbi:MAG: hypothetical protein ACLFMX_08430 [Halobacteriales archaeon]